MACPATWPNALAAFDGGTDSRGCSACSCDGSAVSCSQGNFTIYDDNVCGTGGVGSLDITGTSCVNTRDYIDYDSASYRAVAGSLTGTCAAQDGQPVGSIAMTGEQTFCCR